MRERCAALRLSLPYVLNGVHRAQTARTRRHRPLSGWSISSRASQGTLPDARVSLRRTTTAWTGSCGLQLWRYGDMCRTVRCPCLIQLLICVSVLPCVRAGRVAHPCCTAGLSALPIHRASGVQVVDWTATSAHVFHSQSLPRPCAPTVVYVRAHPWLGQPRQVPRLHMLCVFRVYLPLTLCTCWRCWLSLCLPVVRMQLWEYRYTPANMQAWLASRNVTAVTTSPAEASAAGVPVPAKWGTAWRGRDVAMEVGSWWTRRLVKEYLPALDAANPSLQHFVASNGWPVV